VNNSVVFIRIILSFERAISSAVIVNEKLSFFILLAHAKMNSQWTFVATTEALQKEPVLAVTVNALEVCTDNATKSRQR